MSGPLRLRGVAARAFATLALVAGVTGAAPLESVVSSQPALLAVHALREHFTTWVVGQQEWVDSWGAATQASASAPAFRDQTLRMIVRQHASGSRVRLRLSNAFGDRPVTLSRVRVGIRDEGAKLVPHTNTSVTFDGDTSVTLPAGGSERSDEVPLDVTAGQDLAVSMYVSAPTGRSTWHRGAGVTSYLSSSGDHTDDEGDDDFRTATRHWFFLDAVSVWSSTTPGTIVALGDSITEGAGSTPDANRRWTDRLSARLLGDEDSAAYSVVNAGISGNRVLTDDPQAGASALHRLDRDVLSKQRVRYLILLEGINDLRRYSRPGMGEAIIAGYVRIISAAHDQGIRVIGGTLTPAKGSARYSPALERQRQRVNYWIRTSGQFDGVVDFDKATLDPADPLRFLPRYDCGDHLHPSDKGYRAMGDAVDLALFSR